MSSLINSVAVHNTFCPALTEISFAPVVFPTAKVAAKSCAAGISLIKATVPSVLGKVIVLVPPLNEVGSSTFWELAPSLILKLPNP